MSSTVDELFAMNPETYQIVDIRGEQEVARGAIDGALHLDKDEISAKFCGCKSFFCIFARKQV